MNNDRSNLIDLAERRQRTLIAKTVAKDALSTMVESILKEEGRHMLFSELMAEAARRWASIEREACINIVTRECSVWDDGIFLGENIVAAIRARKQP